LGTVPYYNKPPQHALYAHFKAIAEAVAAPIILYNVPSRTATNMSAETTIKLSQISNIIGIKDAGGDLQVTAQIVEESAPGFKVWSGDDVQTLPLMAVGGYGIVSVASHLVGKQIQEMIGHFLAGRNGEAAALHRKLRPFFNACFVTTNPIPLKYALRKVGFDVGSVRLPLVEPEASQAAVVDAALAAAQIDLPIPVGA
jgi:4-hydroxy-tetrahydrodipicolinate synthase